MKLIALTTVDDAPKGDSEAIMRIVTAFRQYIDRRSIYRYIDRFGVSHRECDEDLRQAAIIGLLSAISGFKYQGVAVGPDDKEYIRSNQLHFISYCTASIDNAINHEHYKRQRKVGNECLYDDLLEDDLATFCTEIENPDELLFAPNEFEVLGKTIYIRDSNLAEALRFQPYFRRDPFLAKFFFKYTDKELAILFRMSERSVRRWRIKIQEDIRDYLSGLE